MNVLIATLMYGEMCNGEYTRSMTEINTSAIIRLG